MELIYLLPRLPPSRRRLEDSSNPQFRLPTPPDAATVTPLSSSSTSSSSPSRSTHCLPPRDNIAAAVINASSSSPRPLSSRLPPDLDPDGDNRRHTALYLGCARALPHPGARISPTGGHQDMALCCHGRVASGATVLPAAVLPLMTPRCRRAAKLAAAATLPPRFPPRCCH